MQKKTKIRNGYAVAAKSRRNAGPMVHKGAKREKFNMGDFIEKKLMKSFFVEVELMRDTGEEHIEFEIISQYVMAENPMSIEQSLRNYYNLKTDFTPTSVKQFRINSFVETKIPVNCLFVNADGSDGITRC
jgi:hypothetical protein